MSQFLAGTFPLQEVTSYVFCLLIKSLSHDQKKFIWTISQYLEFNNNFTLTRIGSSRTNVGSTRTWFAPAGTMVLKDKFQKILKDKYVSLFE